jgi:hypothetical protein
MNVFQESIDIFQRSQRALKIVSIVCGVISLALFGIVLSWFYGVETLVEAPQLVQAFIPGASLVLVGFAFNFVVLDYSLRARIKELVALNPVAPDNQDLLERFTGKLRAHGTVLRVFAGLWVAQSAYGFVLLFTLPTTASSGIDFGLYAIALVSGLAPILVHLKLAKTLGERAYALLAKNK